MIQLAVEEIPKIELKKLVQNFVTKRKKQENHKCNEKKLNDYVAELTAHGYLGSFHKMNFRPPTTFR